MLGSLLLTLALASSPAAHASRAKFTPAKEKKVPSKPLPKILQDLEAKYQKAKTLKAAFNQETESGLTGQKKKSSGSLLVKRPGRIRWETLEPQADRTLLISDGKTFQSYTPPFEEGENGQLIEGAAAKSESRLEQALLSGSFSVARDMGFEQLSPTRYSFTPKKGTAGTVSKATVELDPKALTITQVVIEHAGGNKADIKDRKSVV